jgi:prevent-host-death family protein
MLEVDITHTSITINQLLNQVEAGEEITIIHHGKPVARISTASSHPKPLTSHSALRASQTKTPTSTLETVKSLREEARY